MNLIAIAVELDAQGSGVHSGLIVGVQGVYYLFHYTGIEVKLEPLKDHRWYYHKHLEIIDPKESLAFLMQCELIKENGEPEYGYMFDGSYYNSNGEYISKSGLPECMTCVGFCINVITGFIFNNEKYFEYTDWKLIDNNTSYFEMWLSNQLRENPSIDAAMYKDHYRRITPTEYTASSFLKDLPIRKAAIDSIIENVEAVLKNKFEDTVFKPTAEEIISDSKSSEK